MECVKRRGKTKETLFFLFLKQVIGIATAVLLEIILFVGLFYMGLDIGVILPANYIENYLLQIEEKIVDEETGWRELIPEVCEYGLFDFEENYLEGNLSEPDSLEEIRADRSYQNRYKAIKREDGYVVIRYGVSAQFSNPVLHQYFPQPELLAIVLFWLVFLGIIIVNSLLFGRRLRKKLVPLLTEIEQIKKKELEPTENSSDIKEFNEVLQALGGMKEALAFSLKKEWETEQRRIENISALAHDIKTPLTVIKGNTELLQEETDKVELQEYAEVIHKNADKIEQYIRLLINETKGSGEPKESSVTTVSNAESRLSLAELIEAVKTQSKELCDTKQMPVIIEEQELCQPERRRVGNAERVERTVLNIVSNALEHTTQDAGICMYLAEENGRMCITVEDFGKGFSKEALFHATEQFYTEHKERSGEHYGLGLHFANAVAEELGGELRIENKEDGNGARVSLIFGTRTIDMEAE